MLLGFITGVSFFAAGFLYSRMGLTVWQLPLLAAGLWLALLLVFFVILCVSCALVDLKKPQEEDSPYYRRLMGLTIGALVSFTQTKIHTKGMENFPREGRFLLVCNHQHIADPGVLLHAFRNRQLAFISKKENDSMFLVGKFMHKTLTQLLDRENDREALKTILTCIRLLKEDEASVAVFPEGGINEQRKFKHLKPGVFKIAQKAKVPIVVCTLRDTHLVLPRLLKLKRAKVTLHVLEVIPPEWMEGKTTVEIADYVYGIMAADLGK